MRELLLLAKNKSYGKACTHVQAFFIRSDRCGKKIILYPRIGAYFTALRSIIPKRRKGYRLRKIDDIVLER